MYAKVASGYNFKILWNGIGSCKVFENRCEKRLGLILGKHVNFDDYIFSVCRKAGIFKWETKASLNKIVFASRSYFRSLIAL